MPRDIVLGSATLALAGGYYLWASAIPETLLSDTVGPQGLPKTYAIVLAGLSVILIARSMGRRRAVPASASGPAPRATPGAWWRLAGMLAAGAAYVVTLPSIGYPLALAGLIAAAIYFQGGTLNRQAALLAVSGAVAFWLLFVRVLNIPQPGGWWTSLW